MNWRLPCACLIGLTGCSAESSWKNFADMQPPHNNIEHMVLVNDVGFASVNGSHLDRKELRLFFSDVARNQMLAYIYVVAHEGATERKWADVRTLIEESRVCVRNFCIDGYENDPVPFKAN